MKESDLKYLVFQKIQGIKYLTFNQLNDFKAYIIRHFSIDDNEENNKIIEDTVKLYFELLNN